MNFVPLDLFFVDRLKCAETDVQRNRHHFDATHPHSIQDSRRKMQAGCGGGDGPRVLGKNRLISLAVHWFVLARNIWRQRNMTETLDRLRDVSLCSQADATQSVFAAAEHLRAKLSITKIDALAHSNL